MQQRCPSLSCDHISYCSGSHGTSTRYDETCGVGAREWHIFSADSFWGSFWRFATFAITRLCPFPLLVQYPAVLVAYPSLRVGNKEENNNQAEEAPHGEITCEW